MDRGYPLDPHPVWLQSNEATLDTELESLLEADEQRLPDEAIPAEVPILPLRNTVLFPGVVIPITVARDRSIQLVREAFAKKEKLIGVLSQRNAEVENPAADDLYTIGSLATILRLIRMPDGSVTIVIQGRTRFRVDAFTATEPYHLAQVTRLDEESPSPEETRALMLSLKQEAARIIELSPKIPTEANVTLQNITSLSFLVHFIASNLNLEVPDKQSILELPTLSEKATQVLAHMSKELQVLELSEEIQNKVKGDLDKQQREYILRQQIKAIQDELGDKSLEDELEELKQKAAAKKWPEPAKAAFDKELGRVQRLSPNSPEYGVSMNYLDWLLELPWQDYTTADFTLQHAREVLERDHFGLEKVKERILEYLAVMHLKKDQRAPILCLLGPPGVGKTSLGRSVATALGRQFVRMSLGGVRDEAEIRGHRRTYIGALPGRILQGLKKAKSGNPVMMLDEIDKVGNDFRGDPASALLEVLDPEQNVAFSDHYLDLDYDLSPVMFIATANTLETIHPALRDRMEIIELTGYTLEEKVQIAQRHLLPKARTDHGLAEAAVQISDAQLRAVIEGYTRESGVRKLSQQLAGLCRGLAVEVVEARTPEGKSGAVGPITDDKISKLLGPARFEKEQAPADPPPGVAVGLAWTAVGGEIMVIEVVRNPGSGKLNLTGQLGDVMKESAQVAYIYLKAHASEWGIDPKAFERYDVHIHIPAGAIPKDGPSAGVTLLTALCSAFSSRPVQPLLAMTGEITLRGKVLPVGGVKEKVLAAARAGMTQVMLCEENRRDVAEIRADHIASVEICYVRTMAEVLELALSSRSAKRNGSKKPTKLNGKSAAAKAAPKSTPKPTPKPTAKAVAKLNGSKLNGKAADKAPKGAKVSNRKASLRARTGKR